MTYPEIIAILAIRKYPIVSEAIYMLSETEEGSALIENYLPPIPDTYYENILSSAIIKLRSIKVIIRRGDR